ncbi:MAG: chromophore lyase CpcT/CpeT [Cyanobacteria bacterium P01_F01_bin.42]
MLNTLTQWLIGEFTNRSQAIDDPTWYVHLKLWHRPVPPPLGDACIFAEQANILQPDQPYRQRLLILTQPSPQQIEGQYWAFKSPESYKGCGASPDKLASIQPDDLIELPGCKLSVAHADQTYTAKPHPNLKCCFEYAGKTRQVVIGFEVQQSRYTSYDRGVDPETGRSLWGAMMGPYQFDKLQTYDLL